MSDSPRSDSPRSGLPCPDEVPMATPRFEIPNTALPLGILRPRVLLCSGEPYEHLVRAVSTQDVGAPDLTHQFRCYRFDRYERFTLVWTGIGAGCLEPLLCEMTEDAAAPSRIVLVGTAGATRAGTNQEARVVTRALSACGGVSSGREYLPDWPGIDAHRYPSAVSLSSDFYYGCSVSEDPLRKALREAEPQLARAIELHFAQADLVEMEVAAFYHICSVLARVRNQPLEYVALKAAANTVANPAEQNPSTHAALENVVAGGLAFLFS